MTNKDVTHQIAVERLRAAGADAVADKLAAFRSRDGDLKGWDGHARGEFSKRIVAIIWPEEGTASRATLRNAERRCLDDFRRNAAR